MQSNMGESKVVGPVQRRAISIFGSRFYYVVRPGPENAGYPPNQTAYKAGNHGSRVLGAGDTVNIRRAIRLYGVASGCLAILGSS